MGLKILLGDTSPITRKVFSISLESLDYTPIFVDNEEGFREVMEKENPELAVLSSNITSNPKELIDEIISNYPQTKLILLKSPFEKIEVDESRLFKVLIKPVPSSKIREIVTELKKKESASESFPAEAEEGFEPEAEAKEEFQPQEEELSEEELQAKTWESHSTEEVFPEEEMFPEEEVEEESAFVEEPMVEAPEEEILLEESAEKEEEIIPVEEKEERVVQERTPVPEEPPKVATKEPEGKPAEVTTAEVEEMVKGVAPEIIEKIAWEIIPPLAEKIIREEIEKLKKEIEES